MEQYAKEINEIEQFGLTVKQNGRMRQYLAEKTQKAGFDFLDRIHKQIWNNRPQWEKDKFLTELQADIDDQKNKEMEGKRLDVPELCDEYLLKIGRPDLCFDRFGMA